MNACIGHQNSFPGLCMFDFPYFVQSFKEQEKKKEKEQKEAPFPFIIAASRRIKTRLVPIDK